jgi:hypothetical protein
MTTRRKNPPRVELDGMEHFLANRITPVKPSSEFVRHLGDRLTNLPQPTVEASQAILPVWQYTLLAAASVLGSGLVLAVLFRFVIRFIGRINGNRRMSQKRTDQAYVSS